MVSEVCITLGSYPIIYQAAVLVLYVTRTRVAESGLRVALSDSETPASLSIR